MKRPPQRVRVREMLEAAPGWVCGVTFVQAYILRYSAVIHTLRHDEGLNIPGRPCEQHAHGADGEGGHVFEFRLVSSPVPPTYPEAPAHAALGIAQPVLFDVPPVARPQDH